LRLAIDSLPPWTQRTTRPGWRISTRSPEVPPPSETLDAARAAQADANLTAVWVNTKRAIRPRSDQWGIGWPEREADAGSERAECARTAIQKSDGAGLEADPEMLYGARKQISYLLSKIGQLANPSYSEPIVVRQLQAVKDGLDAVIEPGAPGYQQYLDNYAAASRPSTPRPCCR
jgi:hypothetical protein